MGANVSSSMNIDPDLKPCPFCGMKPSLILSTKTTNGIFSTMVECRHISCPIRNIQFFYGDWQKRATHESDYPVIYKQFEDSLRTETNQRIEAQETLKTIVMAVDELLNQVRSNYGIPDVVLSKWDAVKESVLNGL